jgi:fructokinase
MAGAPPLRLGIDLGGTKIEAAVLDDAGAVHWRERVATPAGCYDDIVDAVAALAGRAREAVGGAPTVGVGHPGSATPDGCIRNANSTCLNGRPLQRDLEARLGVPLRLANDANCLALSEATDGNGAGADVVFAAILGTGVGAGIAVHGRVLGGPNALAGEWGHNPLPWAVAGEDPAPPCYCGRHGCLETLLSGPALAADHARHGGGTADAATIARRAAAGDAACAATLDRHASRLARALAGVVNLLDPDVVVLAGGLSRLPDLVARVGALWGRWTFAVGPAQPLRTRLATARHGDASGVRGAAWLWRES